MQTTLEGDSEAGIKFVPAGTYKSFDDRVYSLALTVTGRHKGKLAKERTQEVAADYEAQGYLVHIEKVKPRVYNIWLSTPDDSFYAKMLSLQLKR